jgi:hypothetical protein
MSPSELGAELLLTAIDGGSRSGRERKCWRPLEPAGTSGSAVGSIVREARSIVKLNFPAVPPTTFNPVVTVTFSPPAKSLSGRKLPPCPSESASILPVCAPLREPATVSWPI